MITAFLRAVPGLITACLMLSGCGGGDTSAGHPAPFFCQTTATATAAPGEVSALDAIAVARDYLRAHATATDTVMCAATLMPASQLQPYLAGQQPTANVWVVVARGGGLAFAQPTRPPGVPTLKVTPSPQAVAGVVFLVSNRAPAQLYRAAVYRSPLPPQFAAIK